MKRTEAAIINRLKKEDLSAFRQVYELYYLQVRYAAWKLVRNEEQANTIAADAFVKLWDKRRDFYSLNGIKNFLLEISCEGGMQKGSSRTTQDEIEENLLGSLLSKAQ